MYKSVEKDQLTVIGSLSLCLQNRNILYGHIFLIHTEKKSWDNVHLLSMSSIYFRQNSKYLRVLGTCVLFKMRKNPALHVTSYQITSYTVRLSTKLSSQHFLEKAGDLQFALIIKWEKQVILY